MSALATDYDDFGKFAKGVMAAPLGDVPKNYIKGPAKKKKAKKDVGILICI